MAFLYVTVERCREARVGEIAKMLSGSEVTEAAVAQARALLGYGGEK